MRKLYSFTKNKGRDNEYDIVMLIGENPLKFEVRRGDVTKYHGYDSVRATTMYESLVNNY